MKHPDQLALDDTYTFVRSRLGGCRRILEVGCGNGRLAARLAKAGFDITALDLSMKQLDVRRSTAKFIEVDFLSFRSAGLFDAILFTASLHHISPLADAVRHAHGLLRAKGRLIVDEFAIEAPDLPTARWYFDTQKLLAVAGLCPPDRIRGAATLDPLTRWRFHHEHQPPLHRSSTMNAALRRHFDLLERIRGPYLYRYLCHHLRSDARGVRLGQLLLQTERERIREGTLKAVGLRWLAQR